MPRVEDKEYDGPARGNGRDCRPDLQEPRPGEITWSPQVQPARLCRSTGARPSGRRTWGGTHMQTSASSGGTTTSRKRRRVPSALVSLLLGVGLSGAGLVALAAPASAVPLTAVSPVDNATGFPFWFGDGGDPGQASSRSAWSSAWTTSRT